jgi:hypothetical protein
MTARAPIPRGLQASIDAAENERPLALLLRHADRAEIPAGDSGNDVGLLAVGRERCEVLARALESQGGVTWAEASPLMRCMTTARILAPTVEASDLLGAPGPFVVNRTEGRRVFGSRGTEHVVRAQMAGHPWPFMRPLEDGVRLLLGHIRDRLGERSGIGVIISHDAIVMPVISWATGDRFEGSWLAPLDGLVIAPSSGRGLTVWWRGEPAEVSL